MEAKVVAIAFVLLLLTFVKDALATTADLVRQNDGVDPPASQKDDFGVSTYAVNWSPPDSQKDDFGVSSYAVNWSPPTSQKDDFGVSSYAVNWSPPASQKDDFGVSSYAVNWSPPSSKKDDFDLSAYAVNWSPPSSKDDFGTSAYAVKWTPSTPKKDDFDVSAYAVNWSPPSSKEDDFDASAYAVKWTPSTLKKDDFGASAYAVNWSPPSSSKSTPKEGDFGVSAYAVNWSPPAPQEDDFGTSAYAVNWSPPASQEKDFSASAYAVKWDEDSAPSHSPVPEAPARHHHIKVQTGMLFLKKNLHVGTVLPEGTTFARAGLPKSDNSVYTPLEPKYMATILSHFKIPQSSMKAKQVADTLRSCNKPSEKEQEEPHKCFSSRGAMARFATKALGGGRTRAAITRIHGQETPSTRYVVAQITPVSKSMVPCHPMDFPYEVFYCHRPKEVQSLRVQLKDQKDGKTWVTTTAMCHMNTSGWDNQYFELLGGERGEPICHYMPQNYIMFY